MRRLVLALAAILLLRADMYPDASNAKLPEARQNLGLGRAVAITDYGADPAGIASSEAAFTSCVTSGKDCRIPAGTYQLGCATHQALSGITLFGDGARSSILKLAAACTLPGNFLSGANVKDLAIDMNGANAGSYSVLSPTYPSNQTPVIERIRVAGGAPAGFLIALSNATAPVIRSNYLAFATSATSAHRCLLFTQAGGPIIGGEISGNRCINSSFWIEADGVRISNNDISGWAYSSAIGFEASASNKRHIVTGNYLHDSATTLDVDSTPGLGMEIWASDSLVANNSCFKVGGSCLDIGGQRNVISGNRAQGINKAGYPFLGAFAARYMNATFNASGSHFVGNWAGDDGSGVPMYGYAEQAGAYQNIIVSGNDFAGATLGQVYAPVSPSTIINTPVAGIYDAKPYGSCTWDATHDVGACINAALAAAAAAGGGTVNLPAGTYGLSTKITWPQTGAVRLTCPSGGGSLAPATTLKWIGAAAGRMVELKPTSGHIQAPSIEGCGFDGNSGLAADGVHGASVYGGRFSSLTFKGGFNGGAVFALTVDDAAGEDAQNNTVDNLYIDSQGFASSSTQIFLGSYMNPADASGANASFNYLRNISIVNNSGGTGTGVICDGCDNNYFSGRIFATASVDLKIKTAGAATGAFVFGANGNVFAPVYYSGTFIARGQTTVAACVPNQTCTRANTLSIDTTNATPLPTIEAGADLLWGGNNGYHFGTMLIGDAVKPALVAASTTILNSCRDAAAGSSATQYLCNAGDTAAIAYNSLVGDRFSTRMAGTNGAKNLVFERQAGTGSYEFAGAPVKLQISTVAALPACNSGRAHSVASVYDQSGVPTYRGALTGGGAIAVLAYCNGTSWEAH